MTTPQIQQQLNLTGGLLQGRAPSLVLPLDTVAPDISFITYGQPAPQGSKKQQGRRLVEVSEELPRWRSAVKAQARTAIMQMGDSWEGLITESVCVRAVFTFPHTAASLKRGDVLYTNTPDLDKLQRAVGDAISPTPVPNSVGKGYPAATRKKMREAAREQSQQWSILKDDSLIVKWDSMKVYQDSCQVALHNPGVLIEVWRMSRLASF